MNKNLTNDFILIAESGIKTSDDIKKFNATGIYNFLIGESLLKSKDKETLDDIMLTTQFLTQKNILQAISYTRQRNTPYLNRAIEKYQIEPQNLLTQFDQIKKLSPKTKFRSFVISLFSGLIYANDKIHKFGITNTTKCDNCPEPNQTTTHMLTSCPERKTFRIQCICWSCKGSK